MSTANILYHDQMCPQKMDQLPEKLVEKALKRREYDEEFKVATLKSVVTGNLHSTTNFQDWTSKITGQRHYWYTRFLDAAYTKKEGWELLVLDCYGKRSWIKAETARYKDPIGLYKCAYELELYNYDSYWYWIAEDLPEFTPIFYWQDSCQMMAEPEDPQKTMELIKDENPRLPWKTLSCVIGETTPIKQEEVPMDDDYPQYFCPIENLGTSSNSSRFVEV